MDQAITVGTIVWPALAILGVVTVLGLLIWLLSIFARNFNH